MTKLVKTLYYDSADHRWVHIKWDPKAGRSQITKLPKTENTEDKARTYVKSNKL